MTRVFALMCAGLGWWAICTFLMGFPFGWMALAMWAIDGDKLGFVVWAGTGAILALTIPKE